MNGVKFKHRGSSHDHNIYEFTFYHFGCIWKMCAFTMFHPLKRTLFSDSANLSIVLFSLELCGIRLICASSLRFTEGFCMEWIKYEHSRFLLFDITFGLISFWTCQRADEEDNFCLIFPKQLWHQSYHGVLRTLPGSNARICKLVAKSGRYENLFHYRPSLVLDGFTNQCWLFAMRQSFVSH